MNNIYLLTYNNYYNRQLKRAGSTSSSYLQYLTNLGALQNPVSNVNFVPGDNVNTTIDLQLPDNISTPDYLLAVDPDIDPRFSDIVSRWFIMDATRIRGSMWHLTLFRDTLADYYYQLLDAPMMVRRGMLSQGDTYLLNSQPGNFNQIKVSQTRLWDVSGCGWLVGYLPKDMFENSTAQDRTVKTTPAGSGGSIQYNYTLAQLQSQYPGVLNQAIYKDSAFNIQFVTSVGVLPPTLYTKVYRTKDGLSCQSIPKTLTYGGDSNIITNMNSSPDIGRDMTILTAGDALVNHLYYTNSFMNTLDSLIASTGNIYDTDLYNRLQEDLNGKIVYDQTNQQYARLRVAYLQPNNEGSKLSKLPYNPLYDQLVQVLNNSIGGTWQQPVNVEGLDVTITGRSVNKPTLQNVKLFTSNQQGAGLYLVKQLLLLDDSISITFPQPQARVHCQDQPFDIFAIPYYKEQSHTKIAKQYDGTNTTMVPYQYVVNLLQQLPALLGKDAVYDIQLLPYSPLESSRFVSVNDQTCINSGSAFGDTPIKKGDETIGWVHWIRNSYKTSVINVGYELPVQPIQKKRVATTDYIRLTSPNFSNFFDFNPVKNNGLTKLYVTQLYKPYNPWIKISPQWLDGGLYERPSSIWDPTGLILSGDFSIAQATSRWADYQLTNKNYLNIFDRQLQQTEFNRNIGRINDATNLVSSTAKGIIRGGSEGGLPGAVIGGATSAAKSGWNFAQSQLRYNESIDFSKDMFSYTLDNIQALPQGLARTAAQLPIDTIVPTLEYWSTTAQQKNALVQRIQYYGMTIQRIDFLRNFLQNGGYFQATPIRLEGIADDFHVLNVIAGELSKGVYLT